MSAATKQARYATNGMRSVMAETMADAAEIFANRSARKQFGRRGYARTCTQNSYAQDGSLAEYNAFIGLRSGPGQTSGHNIMFTVYREEVAQ
jgi:hypothetical protein